MGLTKKVNQMIYLYSILVSKLFNKTASLISSKSLDVNQSKSETANIIVTKTITVA